MSFKNATKWKFRLRRSYIISNENLFRNVRKVTLFDTIKDVTSTSFYFSDIFTNTKLNCVSSSFFSTRQWQGISYIFGYMLQHPCWWNNTRYYSIHFYCLASSTSYLFCNSPTNTHGEKNNGTHSNLSFSMALILK